jgi:hypothetical protein
MLYSHCYLLILQELQGAAPSHTDFQEFPNGVRLGVLGVLARGLREEACYHAEVARRDHQSVAGGVRRWVSHHEVYHRGDHDLLWAGHQSALEVGHQQVALREEVRR